ncbi:CYIR protein [Plasmodium cynomolgi strain B]|uniref:CYIR protein n=1 Tax=Plasmodium cynomolgi (strain B) TaxID=1120755 RepID=K6VJZ0_PLACD|nr:CYIR protein [Plasmodium cynomolgi strain B]GAB69752.1 CYIR protein [Plasmodium cynomolgi strain B]
MYYLLFLFLRGLVLKNYLLKDFMNGCIKMLCIYDNIMMIANNKIKKLCARLVKYIKYTPKISNKEHLKDHHCNLLN